MPRIVALDVESGNADLGKPALEFFERCEARGIPADNLCLYTNYDFIRNRGLNAPSLARYRLWLAAPDTPNPVVPAPWTRISILQTSWRGSVAGIAGDVDLDQVLAP